MSPILSFFKYQQLLAFLRPFLLQYVVTKWVIATHAVFKGKISIPRSIKLARWRPKAATSSHFLTRLFSYSIIAVCRIVGAAAFLGLIAFFCPLRRNITFQSYLLCFHIKLHQILYVYNRLIISEMRAAISKSHEQVLSPSKIRPE